MSKLLGPDGKPYVGATEPEPVKKPNNDAKFRVAYVLPNDNGIVMHGLPSTWQTNGMNVTVMRHVRRLSVEDWPWQCDDNLCWDKPPAWHACLNFTAILLNLYHQHIIKAEGDLDVVVYPRQIIQNISANYGADPSEAAGHYESCSAWLAHTLFTHPETLDALINNMTARGKQKLM
jgi:hypothetical protein